MRLWKSGRPFSSSGTLVRAMTLGLIILVLERIARPSVSCFSFLSYVSAKSAWIKGYGVLSLELMV